MATFGQIAQRMGVSDVWLKKCCAKTDIPVELTHCMKQAGDTSRVVDAWEPSSGKGGGMSDLYETDPALWSEQQAAALRQRAGNQIDWENVAEEIESLGRSDKREIRSRLAVICLHLLKWQFQPEARSDSWSNSIADAREHIGDLLNESPSLRPYPALALDQAYAAGRRKAEREAQLTMHAACPWTIGQVLDHGFWPEA